MSDQQVLTKKFSELLKKYDVPVPRYTSYPTVPSWSKTPTQQEWLHSLKTTLAKDKASWSMYLHLPFCESLCTFCGCNTIITKDHSKSQSYIELLLKEWSFYLESVPELLKTPLKHIHLGGGTPTFLSAQELKELISKLLEKVVIDKNDFEASIEIDPRRTNQQQLIVLKELGFNRVSLGVQDFNSEVQKIIHREQPFEMTREMTELARSLGFESVNFDLIYGLPLQTQDRMLHTLEKTLELKPDRIAFYSFALVPWIKPAQRLFKDTDLPVGEDKRALYEMAREKFLAAGYVDIGMDHFALKTDRLYKALTQKNLHRNFMGYTDHRTDVLLGLGVSSISETPTMFHQNEKLLPKYSEALQKLELPTHRGHVLSERDQQQRAKILELMTQTTYTFKSSDESRQWSQFFKPFEEENLIELTLDQVKVTSLGHPFLRNICSVFDDYLTSKNTPQPQQFSKSI